MFHETYTRSNDEICPIDGLVRWSTWTVAERQPHRTATIDGLTLQAPGATVLRSDERGLPIGRQAVAGTEYDFRRAKWIGSIKLDHAFTDLERDADGVARVELCDSSRDRKLSLWV